MAKRMQAHVTSKAIAELQTALDMQDAAEKLVATRLARLATLLSSADAGSIRQASRRKPGPMLVVSNAAPSNGPLSGNAA
jgi:hypothetical protein